MIRGNKFFFHFFVGFWKKISKFDVSPTANGEGRSGEFQGQNIFFDNALKPLVDCIFIHNHETRVYSPIFSSQTIFYEFLSTKMYSSDFSISHRDNRPQNSSKSTTIRVQNARKYVFHLKSSLKHVYLIVWQNSLWKEKIELTQNFCLKKSIFCSKLMETVGKINFWGQKFCKKSIFFFSQAILCKIIWDTQKHICWQILSSKTCFLVVLKLFLCIYYAMYTKAHILHHWHCTLSELCSSSNNFFDEKSWKFFIS